jgi:hypothetical protein
MSGQAKRIDPGNLRFIHEILGDSILDILDQTDGEPMERTTLHILVDGRRDKDYVFVAARSEIDGAINWLVENGRVEWRPGFPDKIFYTLTALERLSRL